MTKLFAAKSSIASNFDILPPFERIKVSGMLKMKARALMLDNC
jgi:hypothetical protein